MNACYIGLIIAMLVVAPILIGHYLRWRFRHWPREQHKSYFQSQEGRDK
jgi:hypothetical protein